MKLPPFEYACPTTLSEAVALLASRDGDAKALAGGQSLVPMLAFRLAAPTLLVDLRKLAELRGIKITDDGVALGAMVRWRDIEDDKRLATAHPLLLAAVAHVAHYQIRNRGTVGGSIAHADPAAEMPGIAVTCDAEITRRRKSRRARHHGRGFLPRRADDGARARRDHHRDPPAGVAGAAGAGAFRNSRAGAAISRMAAAAVFYDQDASGKAQQRPCRRDRRRRPAAAAAEVEAVLNGQRHRRGHDRARGGGRRPPPSIAQEDIHASAAYRRSLAGTMVERALQDAAAR